MEVNQTILEIHQLKQYFDVSAPWLQRVAKGQSKQILKAVDDISFSIEKGTTFALVGESGCGKSTVAKLVTGLQTPTSGEISFEGLNYSALTTRLSRMAVNRKVTMIFQDPYASLNPRWKVAKIIAEPIQRFKLLDGKKTIQTRVEELLVQVGLSASDHEKYPHEFSGGQRQRISIARALAGEPEFIVCDEPTSALDVSVQAQILNLMKRLQQDLGLTYLFISHDLAVVQHMANTVGVMYLGRLCELSKQLFEHPQHPYTQMLLNTIPQFDFNPSPKEPMTGEVPNPIAPPSGCAFHPRCPMAVERCKHERPQIRLHHQSHVACHLVDSD